MYLNNAKQFKKNWNSQINEVLPQYEDIKTILNSLEFINDVNKTEIDKNHLQCLDILKNINFIKFDASKQKPLDISLLNEDDKLS